MEFMNAYKRLEKLCGDILNDERRISAYIDEMAKISDGSTKVHNWDNDLKKLKHYRWIRNQIVHEPDCQEENICHPDDVAWLNNFYSRIMNQTDPLALYLKSSKVNPLTKTQKESNYSPQRKKYTIKQSVLLILHYFYNFNSFNLCFTYRYVPFSKVATKNYFCKRKRRACEKTKVFSRALFNYTIASINFFSFM